MEAGSSDRRQSPRRRIKIPARLEIMRLPEPVAATHPGEIWDEGDGHPFDGAVIDIGADGARVSTTAPLPRSCRIMATLDLPGYGIVDAVGRVVWCDDAPATGSPASCCAGVSFEVIDVDVREWIARIVAPPFAPHLLGGERRRGVTHLR